MKRKLVLILLSVIIMNMAAGCRLYRREIGGAQQPDAVQETSIVLV